MISATLAAAAAAASWASVRQSRKAFKTSLLPKLDGYWDYGKGNDLILVVHNTGGGVAREPFYYAVSGDRAFSERIVRTGPLRPGEQAKIVLEGVGHASLDSDLANVLCCQDWSQKWHVWARDGRHRLYRAGLLRRTPKYLAGPDAFRVMYSKRRTEGLHEGASSEV